LRLSEVSDNRKNAYFYKTENGAHVGDLFMSLIHTCELNGVNPFHYLTKLQKHASELALDPAAWMPWNYRQTLQPAGTGADSSQALPGRKP
jgi:transposase